MCPATWITDRALLTTLHVRTRFDWAITAPFPLHKKTTPYIYHYRPPCIKLNMEVERGKLWDTVHQKTWQEPPLRPGFLFYVLHTLIISILRPDYIRRSW